MPLDAVHSTHNSVSVRDAGPRREGSGWGAREEGEWAGGEEEAG